VVPFLPKLCHTSKKQVLFKEQVGIKTFQQLPDLPQPQQVQQGTEEGQQPCAPKVLDSWKKIQGNSGRAGVEAGKG
jgi:hypothetical protein